MFAMFLWWATLLIVLGMVVAAPLPERLRAFGLFAFAATAWLLWGLYGAELFADLKWPPQAAEQVQTATPTPEGKDGPTVRLGQVGDLFGGINALFAALAFAGVGVAAYQQWRSTQIAFKQSIETTVFSAIELHHKIADGLMFDRDRIFPARYEQLIRLLQLSGKEPIDRAFPVSGRGVFAEVLLGISFDPANPSTYKTTIDNYAILQDQHNYVLGHYFRNFYQTLKLIDTDSSLESEGKQKYASLLRAQLSSDELAVLMVNCAGSMVDHGEFRRLLVRYRMLEHVPLRRNGHEYLHAGMKEHVVLSDDEALKQYLTEPSVPPPKQKFRGAFGSNPNV